MTVARLVQPEFLLAAPRSIRVGYLELSVEIVPKACVSPSGRYLSRFDPDTLTVRLSSGLPAAELARYFITCVIRIGHWVNGAQTGSHEEAFTQSYASNLVRFALDNPYAWFWFTSLLETRSTGYLRVLQNPLPAVKPRRPKTLLVDGTPWQVELKAMRDRVWGYCVLDEQRIELQPAPVFIRPAIFLHELAHAWHHLDGLTDGTSSARFAGRQGRSLITFIQANPLAWRWVLDGICRIVAERRLAARGPRETLLAGQG